MGQTVDQIEDHIESSREDLRSNLEELGEKVKSSVDWRERFRANPGAVLAIAFGGGFVLANVIGASRGRQGMSHGTRQVALSAGAGENRKGHVSRAWEDIQNALVGVVAAKVSNTLAEVVPGFKEQLASREDAPRVVDGANGAPGKH
jgi:hypothetical protein